MPSSCLLLLFQCNSHNSAHKSGITLDVAGVKWIEPIILHLIKYSWLFQLLCVIAMTHIIRESYLAGSWYSSQSGSFYGCNIFHPAISSGTQQASPWLLYAHCAQWKYLRKTFGLGSYHLTATEVRKIHPKKQQLWY